MCVSAGDLGEERASGWKEGPLEDSRAKFSALPLLLLDEQRVPPSTWRGKHFPDSEVQPHTLSREERKAKGF